MQCASVVGAAAEIGCGVGADGAIVERQILFIQEAAAAVVAAVGVDGAAIDGDGGRAVENAAAVSAAVAADEAPIHHRAAPKQRQPAAQVAGRVEADLAANDVQHTEAKNASA